MIDVDPLLAVQRSSYAAASEVFRSAWSEAQALDAAGMESLLEQNRYCVLATARRDGRAHAAPVAFVVAEGSFWVATVAGLRLRNLRATPWASLVVMDGEADEEEGIPHRALTRHTDPPDWAAAFIELRPERLFSHAAF